MIVRHLMQLLSYSRVTGGVLLLCLALLGFMLLLLLLIIDEKVVAVGDLPLSDVGS